MKLRLSRFRKCFSRFAIVTLFGAWFGNLPLLASPFTEEMTLSTRAINIQGVNDLEAHHFYEMIRVLNDGNPSLDPTSVDDILWLMFQELHHEGFENCSIELTVYSAEQNVLFQKQFLGIEELLQSVHNWENADHLVFQIHTGVKSVFSRLAVNGLPMLTRRDICNVFYPNKGLYVFPMERVYTPEKLANGIRKLRRIAVERGYLDANLEKESVTSQKNHYSVQLDWNAGPLYYVDRVLVKFIPPKGISEEDEELLLDDVVLPKFVASEKFLDETMNRLRQDLYSHGFADARFTYEWVKQSNQPLVTLMIHVETGPVIRIGQIQFKSNRSFSQDRVRNKLTLKEGDFLNPDRVVKDRDVVYRFGAFESIEVNYKETDDPLVRDIIYEMDFKKQNEIYLRLGGGSYDILRVGVDWEQNNLFHRGHSGEFQGVQSFKRSNLFYQYQIPEVFGWQTSLFWNVEYLRREETSFTRHERTFQLGMEKSFPNKVYTSLSYQLEKLDSSTSSQDDQYWKKRGNVGAFQLVVERNTFNNPLYPTKGYRWIGQLEMASTYLGGNSEYERGEIEFSRHAPWSETTFCHLGLRHGVIYCIGDASKRLPFNKRFFNGGPNDMRGFREGQATPLDADGNAIGAASYSFMNLEIEQRLFNRVSVFGFFDAIGFCADLNRYPFNDYLLSVGPGVSFNTFIGPLRLSYAFNFHLRPEDRRHYLRFSIGYPF